MKSFVSLKRHTYIVKQARNQNKLQDTVSSQHYHANLTAKAFRALIIRKQASPPALAPDATDYQVKGVSRVLYSTKPRNLDIPVVNSVHSF
jgi:hypothetical protein